MKVRSKIAIVIVLAIGAVFGISSTQCNSGERSNTQETSLIYMECRCVLGTDLAKTLQVSEDLLRNNALYAVGYIANRSGKSAYVEGRVIAMDGQGVIGEGLVSVALVAPNETTVEPFVVKVCNLLSHDMRLDEIRTEFIIDDVKYK